MSETTERSYYLVESMYFEKLLRTHFMLTQSTLLFEHLLSHSDRPMFLSARKVCEVLGMDRHQLEQCRKKRMIRARAVNGQMLYGAYVRPYKLLSKYPTGKGLGKCSLKNLSSPDLSERETGRGV